MRNLKKRENCCQRNDPSLSECRFLTFEQDQIRQYTFAKDATGPGLHVRPRYTFALPFV